MSSPAFSYLHGVSFSLPICHGLFCPYPAHRRVHSVHRLPMIRENKADITSGLDMWRVIETIYYLLVSTYIALSDTTSVSYYYQYCIVLRCTALYCTVLHCTALYCIVLHFAILYCIALYSLLVLSAFSLILCTGRWLAHHTSHQEHVKLSKHSVVGTIKPVTVGQQPLPSKVAI